MPYKPTPSKASSAEAARAKNKVNAQKVTSGAAKPKPTKQQQNSTVRVSTNRAEKLTKSTVRAGNSQRTLSQRKADNAGVKDGTVRMGANGKGYNVYDAKTATWRRTTTASATKSTSKVKPGQKPPGAAAAKAAQAKKPIGRDTGNHKTTMYANGTARVWDAKQKKFVTVGKSNPLHPKYGK